jgi:membrane-associated phospholipid phosphatase
MSEREGAEQGLMRSMAAVDEMVRTRMLDHGLRARALDAASQKLASRRSLLSAATVFWGVGHLTGRHHLARASLEMMLALGLIAMTEAVLKRLAGRARPRDGVGATEWGRSHDGRASWPSGHTANAVAVATVLADLGAIGTVTGAALTAAVSWSRIEADKHWASDVAAGAAIGYAAAQLAHHAAGSEWRVPTDGAAEPHTPLGPLDRGGTAAG